MADRYPCVHCRKDVAATRNDLYRSHTKGDGEPCEMASEPIPEHVLANGPVDGKTPADVPVEGVDYAVCPQCGRKVKLTRLGYFEPHDTTMRGGDRCPVSGVRAKHARRIEDKLLPGDEPASVEPKVKDSSTPAANRGLAITSPAPTSTSAGVDSSPTAPPPTSGATGPSLASGGLVGTDWSMAGETVPPHEVNLARDPMRPAPSASSSASTEASSPVSTTISTPSPGPAGPSTSSDAPGSPGESAAAGSGPPVLHLAPLLDDRILQPFSHILQPTLWVKAEPMGDLAKELATKIKETFYSYSNRKSPDNRSAQTTLGPSEIGTPCDRRLAMALMGVPPVNPGGDGWAAFVGTCTHVGMADVYTFADAGTGRYAVELPVFLGMPSVPRGTTDLLDRRDGTVVDWKVMGSYSLKKFKAEGPSQTYRTQAHVYGLGAERGGEKVKNVAIVGLPRAGSSLDEMHVWTEKYDRKFAQAALDRVEEIAREVAATNTWAGLDVTAGSMRKAASFQTGDDCRYCPFHLKDDREMSRGCPGK